MPTTSAATAETLGRYAGGSHSTLYEFQVTHARSSLSPMPWRVIVCERGLGVGITTDVGVDSVVIEAADAAASGVVDVA